MKNWIHRFKTQTGRLVWHRGDRSGIPLNMSVKDHQLQDFFTKPIEQSKEQRWSTEDRALRHPRQALQHLFVKETNKCRPKLPALAKIVHRIVSVFGPTPFETPL
jgi:hypothetical protein